MNTRLPGLTTAIGESDAAQPASPLAGLRRFLRPRAPEESCELCSATLGPEHPHLLELASGRLVCACGACAILFSNQQAPRYRRVMPRADVLRDFQLDDVQWAGIGLPIELAFFVIKSDGAVRVYYPSPGGAIESLMSVSCWEEIVAANPILKALTPEVEALLVNRTSGAREYYRVSIDECYKLIGLVRMHWRGFSGGDAWTELSRYFAALQERGKPPVERS